MTDKAETFAINQAEEAFVRDFCPYKGSPDPLAVWMAAWASCSAVLATAQQGAQPSDDELNALCESVMGRFYWSNSAHQQDRLRELVKRGIALAALQGPTTRPDALTWYEGAPPFPQDQEWFIAETIHGDRVVLRSMDEGREHKGNYAFKTADETYMKAEIIKRWMQFPDCDYVPPEADPNAPWLTEAHMLCTDHGIPAGHITERLRSLRNKLAAQTVKRLTAEQLDKLIQAHVGGSELNDGEYSAMVMFAAAVERAYQMGARE